LIQLWSQVTQTAVLIFRNLFYEKWNTKRTRLLLSIIANYYIITTPYQTIST